jgi:hypothetical protein
MRHKPLVAAAMSGQKGSSPTAHWATRLPVA